MSHGAVHNMIANTSTPPTEDTWSVLLDPVTEEPAGRAARSGAADAALAAATAGFERWRRTIPADRSRALLRIADAAEAAADELAAPESADTGKPLALTLAEEILPTIDQLRFLAGAARVLVQEDEIVQEEIFGPVLTVQPAESEEAALALANGVPQALACSVWTHDHATAMRASRLLDSGCAWLNSHLRFAAEMPHGGFGQSGYGKDLSTYALDDYTRVKHVMTLS
jgi:acyl-CoA reductase-like NAD-dependent aldehyde dehydrogenase